MCTAGMAGAAGAGETSAGASATAPATTEAVTGPQRRRAVTSIVN
jgi:hypothetical protein